MSGNKGCEVSSGAYAALAPIDAAYIDAMAMLMESETY